MTDHKYSVQVFAVSTELLEADLQTRLVGYMGEKEQYRINTLGTMLYNIFVDVESFGAKEMVILSLLPMLMKEARYFSDQFINLDAETAFGEGDLLEVIASNKKLVESGNPQLLLQIIASVMSRLAGTAQSGHEQCNKYPAGELMAEMFFMNALHMRELFNGLGNILADSGTPAEQA